MDFGKSDIQKIGKSLLAFVVLVEEVGKAECALGVGKQQRSRAKPFIPIWQRHLMSRCRPYREDKRNERKQEEPNTDRLRVDIRMIPSHGQHNFPKPNLILIGRCSMKVSLVD